jgi:hypothetical protein
MSPAVQPKAAATPQLPPPEFAKSLAVDMETDAKALVRRVGLITIRTQPELAQAAIDRQDLGERLKRVDEFFKPFTDMAHKLHKALCARRDEIKAPIELLDNQIRLAISGYKQDEDRRRREEEQRIAEERRRAEEVRLSIEAAALERDGDHEAAAAVLEAALDAPAPVVVLPDTTKVDGLSFRKVWRWRYLNDDKERALQLIPRDFLCVDESKLTKYAGAMRESAKVPGIQFYSEDLPVRGR